ncbi:hypothetical protein CDL12_17595 [Handroanthus impetiginosus]|uniref:Uncharacterized protein n=1 Tax=Handroanthus impetiginosus TaxID=429701 RepID=A0A2G9GX25_9LAMI|nr:hypothetical protein CDL12_17595 [Handroanthus impetiginosus]
MFPMLTQFFNSGQQTIQAARYIGQGFMITLSHENRLPVTIQYPYEKLMTSEHFQEYELSTCDRHELNYNQISLGRLPVSIIDDYTIRTISSNSPEIKNV